MRYPSELYRKADALLSERRQCMAAALQQRKDALQAQYPEIHRYSLELYTQGVVLGKLMFGCSPKDQEQLIADFQQKELQFIQTLEAAGLPCNYLVEQPNCPLCRDKGYIEGKSCQCRQAILNQLAYEWLSNISRVGECSFESFHLDYYQDDNRHSMERLLTSCKRYAENFSLKSPNLLFIGPTGLGKTHLSLSIAREVVNTGRLVLYASAVQLLDRLVDISFNNLQDEYKDIAYGCDLLIVDDLGTEFQTRFTKSEVYNIINTRQIEGRPTIINTNLSLQEIEHTYDQRVVSRLVGHYVSNPFAGKDIRFQKQLERLQRRK